MEARVGAGGVRTAAACSGVRARVKPSRSPQDGWNPPWLLQPPYAPARAGLGLCFLGGGSACGAGVLCAVWGGGAAGEGVHGATTSCGARVCGFRDVSVYAFQ